MSMTITEHAEEIAACVNKLAQKALNGNPLEAQQWAQAALNLANARAVLMTPTDR